MRGALTAEWIRKRSFGPVYGYTARADFGGEFSRKEPVSNVIGAGYYTLVMKALKSPGGRVFAAVDPVTGIEFGRNLNRPSLLFDESVDLTGCRAIGRLPGGASAILGVNRRDEGRSFDLQASYRIRALNSRELMVTYRGDDAFPELNGKPRYFVDVNVNAHVTKWSAITVAYKLGSLPPLFSFVDHQVSAGFTIQAKQRRKAELSERFQ